MQDPVHNNIRSRGYFSGRNRMSGYIPHQPLQKSALKEQLMYPYPDIHNLAVPLPPVWK